MNTSNLTSAGRFNSDDIYVNVYRRVCPSSTPNQSERQKISDLHFSTKKPMEVKLKIFLDMGKDCIDDLELIANTDDKTQRSFLKRERLSAGSISGTFHTRDRKVPLSKKLKHYNGIIALDFDNVDDVEAGKKTITQLPYVYYVGLSASRRGFFAIVPLDNTDYTRHSLYFSALQMEMDKIGFTIDKACSDVTRLRFVSYDPSPYYNEDCELYTLPEGFGEESTDPIREKKDDAGDNPKLARVKAYAQEWEKKKIPLDDYDDWRTIAMSLSSLGEDGWDILDTVSRFSKSYDAGDNRKKFDEFLKNTRSIGIGSFFFKCQEYGVIPPSIPHYEMIPFPVEVFPEPIRKIISETHKCLNFSVDHIASSLLFAASIAVGNSIIVEIKNEWIDKAILYVAIVGKPGTNKSAPLRYALRPLAERDKKEMDRYEKLKAAYDEQMRAPSKERKKTLVEPEYVQNRGFPSVSLNRAKADIRREQTVGPGREQFEV